MAIAGHITVRSRMASELASISMDEALSNLWRVNATDEDEYDGFQEFDSEKKSLRYWVFKPYNTYRSTPPDFFVAGLSADTTTGVLRQHLMRLNSSISCEEIDTGDFPSPCPGDRPFTVSWERVTNKDVNICVPGNYTAFPWKLSRSRQEHVEELYIDIKDIFIPSAAGATAADPDFNTSSTIRCSARTTRGYFELGNIWNNNTYGPYGPLLEQWPNPTQIMENFNDWTDTEPSNKKDQQPYFPSDM
jgi:hypothetical protein